MKKLVELYGIDPGLALQLEQAGVNSVADLAGTGDLSRLSEKSGVPVDTLKQLQDRSLSEVSRARLQRRRVAILLAIVAGLLGALTLWSYSYASKTNVTFRWKASSSPNVIYNIYRSQRSGGPYMLMGHSFGTSFTDASVSAGRTYYYVVSAVDPKRGMESAKSNEISLTVPRSWVPHVP